MYSRCSYPHQNGVSSGGGLLVASLPAEAPLEHNFRYPRIRELMYMGGALALGRKGGPFEDFTGGEATNKYCGFTM